MTRITGPTWGCDMRRLWLAALALLLAALPLGAALGQSAAGTGPGGGGSSGSTTLTGTLPAFAATPTFNIGTIGGIATDTSVQAVRTALGSPFQAGGSIANTGFAINGALPAFAATPTVNLGTLNGVALDASVQAVKTALGSPLQAGGNVAVTSLPLASGAATATNQSSEIAQLTTANQRSTMFADANGSVPSTATFTSTARDAGGTVSQWAWFTGSVNSTTAGTLYIDSSTDNTTWVQRSTAAVAAGAGADISVRITFRYNRTRWVTGATAANIVMTSAYTTN